MHSTNYFDSLIVVSPDCSALAGLAPKGETTIAVRYYQMIATAPYQWTSDDVIFAVFAERNGVLPADLYNTRKKFFSRGQPCLRACALVKTYGWGVHHNGQGRVAIYGVETGEYARLAACKDITNIIGMRSRRA